MAIVCLGWGSLVWDARELPCVGVWRDDGPELPIEFARQSQDGRLTLVLVEGRPSTRSLWCELNVATILDARTALAKREGSKPNRIGYWPSQGSDHFPHADAIARWAGKLGLKGVVWTALPPKFNNTEVAPTLEEAVAYVMSLEGEVRSRAADYIRNAPAQVATAYRPALSAALV